MAVSEVPGDPANGLPGEIDPPEALWSVLHADGHTSLLLDKERRIAWAAGSVADVLGYRPDELAGQPVAELVPEASGVELAAMLDRVNATTATITLLNRQNAPIGCDVHAVPLLRDGLILLLVRDVSHRVAAAHNVEASSRRFRRMIQDVPLGIGLQDRDGNFVFLNERFQSILGSQSTYLLRDEFRNRINRDDLAELTPDEHDHPLNRRCRFTTPDGSELVTDVLVQPEFGDEGLRLWTVEDLTPHIRAAEDQARLLGMIAGSPDLVILTDRDGTPTYLNPAARAFLGIADDTPLDDEPPGVSDLAATSLAAVQARTDRAGTWHGDVELRGHDNSATPFSAVVNAEVTDNGEVTGHSIVLHDMTERKKFELQLEHEATHDPMTQLPNRLLLNRRLDEALAIARTADHWVGVAFLDIDRFRSVNETLGHHVGDDLLRQTAQKLQSSIGPDDTVARCAADEFAVLMVNLDSPEEGEVRAEAIRSAVTGRIGMAEVELRMTLSAGVAVSDGTRADAGTLTRDANAALHEAKLRGRDRTRAFTASMRSKAVERLTLETSLRRALRREEFVVFYQPQIALRTGKITGMEALVRWQHPEMGLTSPSTFVEIAEQTGLIVPLGAWVLRDSCQQLVAWNQEVDGADQLSLGINLSGRQIEQPTIVDDIGDAIRASGVDPDQIELELTESILIDDLERSISILDGLKELGVRLALDDFGTGFSSLTYLRSLPIDVVKIDRSFVDGITSDPENAAIVRSIVDLASVLGLECIAEGVDNDDDLATLRELGCDYVQGFLVSKPLNANDFCRLLRYDLTW